MTKKDQAPFVRVIDVSAVPGDGLDVVVEASELERVAVAEAFGVPAIQQLVGRFSLKGSEKRMVVKGQIEAALTQICVVTLEPFDTKLTEDVEVAFAPARPEPKAQEGHHVVVGHAGDLEHDADPPDELHDGKIDLGALSTEFLALGLDPYPRKPGVEFKYEEDTGSASPFADLAKLGKKP